MRIDSDNNQLFFLLRLCVHTPGTPLICIDGAVCIASQQPEGQRYRADSIDVSFAASKKPKFLDIDGFDDLLQNLVTHSGLC